VKGITILNSLMSTICSNYIFCIHAKGRELRSAFLECKKGSGVWRTLNTSANEAK
jgi:hypothetical protein